MDCAISCAVSSGIVWGSGVNPGTDLVRSATSVGDALFSGLGSAVTAAAVLEEVSVVVAGKSTDRRAEGLRERDMDCATALACAAVASALLRRMPDVEGAIFLPLGVLLRVLTFALLTLLEPRETEFRGVAPPALAPLTGLTAPVGSVGVRAAALAAAAAAASACACCRRATFSWRFFGPSLRRWRLIFSIWLSSCF